MQTMRLFADVAKYRSLSEAASVHGVTQSAASQRIRSLEQRLGVQLLDRTVRPVSLTPAGRVYLKGCQELMARTDAIERQVRMVDAEPAGVVRVFAMYSTGIRWMSDVQKNFAARCPEASVQLHYDRPDVIHRALLDGECDLGLVSFPDDWKSVGSMPLRQEPMALVCPADHDWADQPEPIDLKSLTGQRMAGISLDLPMGRRTARAIKEAGGQPIIVDTFDNIDTLKVAVLEANCLALIPACTVEREQASGVLKLLKTTPALSRPVGLIYDKACGMHPVARAFADQLATAPERHPPEEKNTAPPGSQHDPVSAPALQ